MAKWNERYEIIVRLDTTAMEKDSSLPAESSTRILGAKGHRGPNESPRLAVDFVTIEWHSKLRPDRYERQNIDRVQRKGVAHMTHRPQQKQPSHCLIASERDQGQT